MRAGEVETLVGKASEVFAEFSLKRRKQMAICTFVEARENSYTKLESYSIAAMSARVSCTALRGWVKSWLADDGFFTNCNSGTNTVRNNLCESDVKQACIKWWLDHPPGRKGQPMYVCTAVLDSPVVHVGIPNVRIVDFKNWLCGSRDQPGLLATLDLPYSKKNFSEETLRLFVHRIGFSHESSGFGCFSDAHESPENKLDRTERYLPQYMEYFAKGITQFMYQGQLVGVDDRIVDMEGADLTEARVTMHPVTNADGLTISIDMGGIVPGGSGLIYLHTSHDESCFAAGDFETSVRGCLDTLLAVNVTVLCSVCRLTAVC